MRGRVRRRADEAGISLLPFVDISLVLVVFLILVSLRTGEEAIPVNIGPPESICEFTHIVELYSDGSIRVGYDNKIYSDNELNMVQQSLNRIHNEFPNCPIFVFPGPGTKAGLVIQIQDLAYNAGHSKNVVIATESYQREWEKWDRWITDVALRPAGP